MFRSLRCCKGCWVIDKKAVCYNNALSQLEAFLLVAVNLLYILHFLFCHHSYKDFEKGASFIQGPSSLAGESCYLSPDFDGVVS